MKVSLAEAVQKLPLGQSLVTVTEGGRAVMQVNLHLTPSPHLTFHPPHPSPQVKLPPTLVGQYWSLISVGAGQASIQVRGAPAPAPAPAPTPARGEWSQACSPFGPI